MNLFIFIIKGRAFHLKKEQKLQIFIKPVFKRSKLYQNIVELDNKFSHNRFSVDKFWTKFWANFGTYLI